MKLGKVTKNLQPTLVMAGGAIAGGYLSKVIPFGSDKVKNGVVLLAGLLMSGQKGLVGTLGSGVAIGGALKLAQGFGIGGGTLIGGIDDGGNFINGIDDLYAGGNIMGVQNDGMNDNPYSYNNSYGN